MEEIMVMIPVREYRELIEAKVSAEKDLEHVRSEKYRMMDEIKELKKMIAGDGEIRRMFTEVKGDDLK